MRLKSCDNIVKNYIKKIFENILAWQVRRLCARNDFKIVAVAGSVGKTSTKFAVAQMLSAKLRVRFQEGNYNVPLTVPLVFFGVAAPSLINPLAWLKTFLQIERMILRPYPYDVVVVELGTDGPGQLAQFASWLRADIGVLTAIAPEHMEFFGSMDAVAQEELTIRDLSDELLVNSDLVALDFMPQGEKVTNYSIDTASDYRITRIERKAGEQLFSLEKRQQELFRTVHSSISKVQLYSICVACAVADRLGFAASEIKNGITRIRPVAGRMQILHGIKNSTIIDETYNSSPDAAKAALMVLFGTEGSQKIALLGDMNELGAHSAAAHTDIGSLCSPEQLDVLITLGPDANKYLATAAEAQGCRVIRAPSPHEAAAHIKSVLLDGAVILAKGSQNNVFAEEVVKDLLADPNDVSKLVRQSEYWRRIKRKRFADA